jgi:hypothetical protein
LPYPVMGRFGMNPAKRQGSSRFIGGLMDWLEMYFPKLARRETQRRVLALVALGLPVCVVVMTVLVLWQEGGR